MLVTHALIGMSAMVRQYLLESPVNNRRESYIVPMAKTAETPSFFFIDIIDCQIRGNSNIETSETRMIAVTVMYSNDASTQ